MPIALSVFMPALLAQVTPTQAAHSYAATHQAELLQQFKEFAAIPDVAADPAGLRRNADYLIGLLRQRGVKAQLLSAPGLPDSVPPVVYGELKTPNARRTIVFYAHYDGQPVTPSEWDNGAPFTPVVKQVDGEPRIYARAAADDKAAIFAQLTALSALQAAQISLKTNIRLVWEGEEEAGSTHLGQILAAHRLNIDSLLQKPGFEKSSLPFVITLEPCRDALLHPALEEMAGLDFAIRPCLCLPILR